MFNVKMTIGLSDADGRKVEGVTKELNYLKRDIALMFGGYTGYTTEGGYTNKKGNLIIENSYRLEVVLSEDSELTQLKNLIRSFLLKTNQESALLIYKDNVEFLENGLKIN